LVDALELLGRVAGWVFWLAGAAAVGSAGLSMLYLALGDRDRAVTLFKGSMAAILVAAFGQAILLSVIGTLGGWQLWSAQAGQVTRYPEAGTVVYVLAFIMLLLTAVNLARGRVEEGGWMIVGSVLILALVVFAANAFNNTVVAYGGGPLLVEARTDKAMYEPGQEVFLYVTVRASGLAINKVNLTVDWGDGSRPTEKEAPVGREVKICYEEGERRDEYDNPYYYCEGKKYNLRRGEESSFYTIEVKAEARAGGRQLTGSTYVTVYVRKLPGLAFPFSVLGGFLSWLMNLLTGGTVDPTRLFYAPVFRFEGPEGQWYKTVLTASIALLPIFLLFRIAPGLAYEPGRAIVDGFRDAAFAVVAMILIPHAYNVTAGALNTFVEMLMGPAGSAIVSQMAGTAIAWAVIFMVVSLVSPGVGFLGTAILMTILMVAALASLRWFILLTAVSISPFLVLAWLHPYLRGGC
jgi:carbon starvation protein